MEWIEKFLNQFYGTPEKYYSDFSLDIIIRCEATHFFFSAFMGFLVAWLLIRTISYQKHWKCHDRYIFLFSFWWGLFVALLVHVGIDAFTNLA